MGKKEIMPKCVDFAMADGKIWYSSCLMNGLFCQSIEGGRAEFMGCFPGEDILAENLYNRVFLVDRELIFVPFCARHITIYHLDYRYFETFDVPDAGVMVKYVSAVLLEKVLYLFPACAKKAIVFDVAKKTVSELKEFNQRLDCLTDHIDQKFYMAGTARQGNYIYLALKDTEQLIRYSCKDDIFSQFSLNLEGGKLGSLAADQDCLYIGVSGKNYIISRDIHGKEKKITFQLPDSPQLREICDFPIMQCYSDHVFLYFMGQNAMYKIDRGSMKVEQILLTKENKALYLMKQEREELFFLPCEGHSMYRYHIDEGKVYEMPMASEKRNIIVGKWWCVSKDGMTFYEKENVSLKDYMEMVLESKERMANVVYSGAGRKIWENIKALSF